ncbi:hypothetical protein ScPMuIL_013205 [Solemya velum]
MAAVGCMEESSSMDSEESGDKNEPAIADICKKNGVSYKFYCQKRTCCVDSKSLTDKIVKVNGAKLFTKPSIPTLRSRKDNSSRRKRRPSKQDKKDATESATNEVNALESLLPVPTVECITENSLSSIPDAQEVAAIFESQEQVTPDTSRSCTPLSISGSCTPLSPAFKDRESTDFNCKDTSIKCKWRNCDISLDPYGLMDHIRDLHVESQSGNETFVCLWEGCKVYNRTSCSQSWLERHILFHSGDKPFRCIVDGCGMRFTTQSALERHVNGHFNTQPPSGQKIQKSREETPTKLYKKKKLKRRRPLGVKSGDFFDSGIMDQLQQELSGLNKVTQIDLNGSHNSVTFHSIVIAKRTEASGKVKVLLHWTPEDVLPDSWVLESQVPEMQTSVIPLTSLPHDLSQHLHPSLYRRHRFRKHRRK